MQVLPGFFRHFLSNLAHLSHRITCFIFLRLFRAVPEKISIQSRDILRPFSNQSGVNPEPNYDVRNGRKMVADESGKSLERFRIKSGKMARFLWENLS